MLRDKRHQGFHIWSLLFSRLVKAILEYSDFFFYGLLLKTININQNCSPKAT